MRRVMIVGSWLALATGCSLVNDPGAHQGGAADGGVDAGVDAGPTPVPANELCDEFGAVYCTANRECCLTTPLDTQAEYEECVRVAASSCASQFGALLADGRTGYDPSVAGVVLAEAYALLSTCSLDILEWYAGRSGLQRVFAGTVPAGELCTPEPRPGLEFDTPALFSCEGIGFSCVPAGTGWSCVGRREAGESCVLYRDCVDGMRCTRPIGGVCEPRRADGQPCYAGTDCSSLVCMGVVGLTAGTCQAATRENVYCAPPT